MTKRPASPDAIRALCGALDAWAREVPLRSRLTEGGRTPRDRLSAEILSDRLRAVSDAALRAFRSAAGAREGEAAAWTPFMPQMALVVGEASDEARHTRLQLDRDTWTSVQQVLHATGVVLPHYGLRDGEAPVNWSIPARASYIGRVRNEEGRVVEAERPATPPTPRERISPGELIPSEVLDALESAREALAAADPGLLRHGGVRLSMDAPALGQSFAETLVDLSRAAAQGRELREHADALRFHLRAGWPSTPDRFGAFPALRGALERIAVAAEGDDSEALAVLLPPAMEALRAGREAAGDDLRWSRARPRPAVFVNVKGQAMSARFGVTPAQILEAEEAHKALSASVPAEPEGGDLDLRGPLEERVADELASDDGARLWSAAEIADRIQRRLPSEYCDTPPSRDAINGAIRALRARGWPIETVPHVGHRIPPSERHRLPAAFRQDATTN